MIPPVSTRSRARLLRVLFGSSLLALSLTAADAQTLTWDGGMTGGPAGGSGTWDNGTTDDWYTGTADNPWVAGNDAVFGGTAGTVTIASGGVTANSLLFNTTGYTVTGGTLTLTGASSAGGSTITMGTGVTDTISSVIAGTTGLNKAGAGTLVLTAANTLTGVLNVGAGTLQLGTGTAGNDGTLSTGVTAITVGAGATYTVDYNGTLNNQGSNGGISNVPITGPGNITLLGQASGYYGLAANRNPFQIGGTTTINLSPTAGPNFDSTIFVYDANVLSANSVLNVLSGQVILRNANGEVVAGLTNAGTAAAGTMNNGGFIMTDQNITPTLTVNTAPGTSYTYGGVLGKSAVTGNNQLALTKNGLGTQILTGLNTYTGPTTVNAGTLTLDATNGGTLAATTTLTFGGTGTFNYQGAAAGSTQTLGALAFTAGGGIVQSSDGTSGVTQLTFASLTPRTAGATGNFVTSGGTNGTTNRLSFTTAPTTGTVLDPGLFFNGANYAAYDTGGFVRAFNYASDATGVTSPGGATFDAGATYVTGTAVAPTSDVNMTGSVTAEPTATINTLKVSNNSSLTLASGATLSLAGILQSGNVAGGATISGGTGVEGTAAGAELVIRTDGVNDALTISTPILAAQTGSLTKSGDGTLTLTAASTLAGAVNVNRGTLQLGNGSGAVGTTGSLASISALTVGAGATFVADFNADSSSEGIPTGVSIGGAGNVTFLGEGTGYYNIGTTLGFTGSKLTNSGITTVNLTPSTSASYEGTVFLQQAGVLSATSTFNLLSGNADMRGNQSVLGLTGAAAGHLTTDGGGSGTVFTVTPAVGTSYTFGGTVGTNYLGTANTAGIGFAVNGAGTQILAGTANYTGPTTVTTGTLQYGNGTAGTIGGLTSAITVNSGANVIFNDNAQETLTATITGAGNVTFQGLGTGYINVNGALTNTGTTTVALTAGAAGATGYQGALFLANNVLSAGSVLNVTSGNLDFRGNETVLGLTGTGGSITQDGGSRLITIAPAAGQRYAYSGLIGAFNNGFNNTGISVTLAGAGTEVLTGTNNYTGTTTITTGGTLLVNGTNSGTGTVTVGSGATSGTDGTLGGRGTITGAVNVTSSGAIMGANVGNTGTLTTGALTLTSGSALNADLLSSTVYDKVVSTGAVTLGGATLNLTGLTNASFTSGSVLTLVSGTSLTGTFANAAAGTAFTVNGYVLTADYTTTPNGFDLDIAAVPEPATWLGGGLLVGVTGYSLRRRFNGVGVLRS